MINYQDKTLAQAMSMTQNMLELAKTESWDEVAEIEVIRQKLIFDNLEVNQNIDPSSQLGVQIKGILTIDKEIQLLVNSARVSLRDELLDMSRSKNQVSAYQQP